MSDGFWLTRRLESFRFASRGVLYVLRTQHNAWIHAGVTVAVVVVSFCMPLSVIEWCVLVLAITAVWTAEAFNTALESLSDAVCSERDPLVGRAKDAAAGAVLLASVGAAAVGVLVLGPHLWEKL
jgi:diacylglycerol kinase (ATP)